MWHIKLKRIYVPVHVFIKTRIVARNGTYIYNYHIGGNGNQSIMIVLTPHSLLCTLFCVPVICYVSKINISYDTYVCMVYAICHL